MPENFPEKPGIYAGWAYVGGGKKPAVFHYGAIPTFGIETPSLEAHLLSAGNAAALPETAEFEFLEFLRPVLKFGSVAELQAAIAEDVRRTADILRLPS